MSLLSTFNFWTGHTQAQRFLKDNGILFQRHCDGTLTVRGNIDISNRQLLFLPDLSSVRVEGYFTCARNRLAALYGAPFQVDQGFFCNDNRLTSLHGAPKIVGMDFDCGNNRLTTFQGGPDEVYGDIWCYKNPLASLQHLPGMFRSVASDFGLFRRGNIPANLLLPPELRQPEPAPEDVSVTEMPDDVTLHAPLRVGPALRFRKGI